MEKTDILVVGAGFFGLRLALYAKRMGFGVLVVEREESAMTRASLINQARVHLGYHYPRAYTTAARSKAGSEKFIKEYHDAIKNDFTKIYAIAARGSLVTPPQFEKFMERVGSPLERRDDLIKKIFTPGSIAGVWEAAERAFNANIIKDILLEECEREGVEIRYSMEATVHENSATLSSKIENKNDTEISFKKVIIATYAGLGSKKEPTASGIDLQITEMLLLDPGPELRPYGITIMDGPFLSMMPWPAGGDLYSLSHVKITPHRLMSEEEREDPYKYMDSYTHSAEDRMVAAARKFLPDLASNGVVRSMREIKALPKASVFSDSRPIVWEQSGNSARVLGSKLDCIYDAEEMLEMFLQER